MSTHPFDCECDTYGCVLRRKGVAVAPSATPSRHNRVPAKPSVPPGVNAKIIYQDRPGGYKMPIFTKTGDPLRHKQYQEQRHKINDQLAKVQAGKA